MSGIPSWIEPGSIELADWLQQQPSKPWRAAPVVNPGVPPAAVAEAAAPSLFSRGMGMAGNVLSRGLGLGKSLLGGYGQYVLPAQLGWGTGALLDSVGVSVRPAMEWAFPHQQSLLGPGESFGGVSPQQGALMNGANDALIAAIRDRLSELNQHADRVTAIKKMRERGMGMDIDFSNDLMAYQQGIEALTNQLMTSGLAPNKQAVVDLYARASAGESGLPMKLDPSWAARGMSQPDLQAWANRDPEGFDRWADTQGWSSTPASPEQNAMADRLAHHGMVRY